MINIRRALISVSDKTGIVPFAKKLQSLNIEIISTGGTAKTLSENGIKVIPIDRITGFPEMMDGRVKTLHPKIHGALLGIRDNAEHAAQAKAAGIEWIDLVVVNLYPFEKTVSEEGVTLEDAIENIDIGGPAMLRSAAKNHRYVAVLYDPADYTAVLDEIETSGTLSPQTRQRLAARVFQRTADYDSAIDLYLSRELLRENRLRLTYSGGSVLRYGENSHQGAMFFKEPRCMEPSVAGAEIVHGKEMSYNNYVDADAALEAVKELEGIGVAVIKHTNPCGYATGETPGEALERAWAGDPISAFGSVIACNAVVDLPFAEFLKGANVKHYGYVIDKGRLVPQALPGKFVEVVIAPDFTADALALLGGTKNLRILKIRQDEAAAQEQKTYRKITGGMLEMDRDLAIWEYFNGVTEKQFDASRAGLAKFAYTACKHTKSNAIVIGAEYRPGFYQVMGMGAGQPNRVDSLRKLALTKVLENLQILYDAGGETGPFEPFAAAAMGEMVMASDAFFPFEDTVRAAAAAGIRYIVQPGGSKRDPDSIAACNELGVAMALTGMRHFRH